MNFCVFLQTDECSLSFSSPRKGVPCKASGNGVLPVTRRDTHALQRGRDALQKVSFFQTALTIPACSLVHALIPCLSTFSSCAACRLTTGRKTMARLAYLAFFGFVVFLGATAFLAEAKDGNIAKLLSCVSRKHPSLYIPSLSCVYRTRSQHRRHHHQQQRQHRRR